MKPDHMAEVLAIMTITIAELLGVSRGDEVAERIANRLDSLSRISDRSTTGQMLGEIAAVMMRMEQ